LLNISLEDSLAVTDSLISKNFLKEYSSFSLNELKQLAKEKRNDLKSLSFRLDAANQGEKMVLAQFAPQISLSTNITWQAQLERANVSWNDYIRSKSIMLSVYWPVFEGGRKLVDYQIAKIKTDQIALAISQAKDGALLDIEEKFYSYQEVIKSLEALQQAMDESKESMRISSLMYKNGMSTQLDVLNAQLLYTKSKSEYLQGIFNYNISQLKLLNSVGIMDSIWK
jgi:outer membrane protein TolC